MKILHRDLKSDNVLLTTSDPENIVCKIIDFGLSYTLDNEADRSKDIESGDAAGVGTPAYMAPEMLTNDNKALHDYPFACDIYSYGILAYVVLTYSTRIYPHEKGGGREILWAVVHRGLRPAIIKNIERHLPHLPPEADGSAPPTLSFDQLIENISTQISPLIGKLYGNLITLIRQCWEGKAEKRPNFTRIANEMSNCFIEQNSNMDELRKLYKLPLPTHVSGSSEPEQNLDELESS